MKRIGTVFLILFSFFAISAHGQAIHMTMHPSVKLNSIPAMAAQRQNNSPIQPSSVEQPLTTQIDTVFYYGDTSAGAWVYVPVLDQASGDSLGYYGVSQNGLFYYQTEDTIGPLGFLDQTGAQHTIDNDTMYSRIMGVRFSTPTDITLSKLVGADLTIFPISFNSTDSILFWVVPMADVPFGNGDIHPIPQLFGTRIASAFATSNEITVGQLNTVHVTFNASVRNYKQFAILAFVAGPNFPSDTLGFVLDQNLQSLLTGGLQIDTDGSLGVTGEPMRTYQLNLDKGNATENGKPDGPIGGGGGFFVNFAQLDPTSGQQTASAFDGNLLLTAYISGNASAVNPNALASNALSGNYPDPVGTQTDINYTLAQSGPVSLVVYNTLGEQVATVVNGMQGAGEHSATFNTGTLPNGAYCYKLQSGDFTATRTMIINR